MEDCTLPDLEERPTHQETVRGRLFQPRVRRFQAKTDCFFPAFAPVTQGRVGTWKNRHGTVMVPLKAGEDACRTDRGPPRAPVGP